MKIRRLNVTTIVSTLLLIFLVGLISACGGTFGSQSSLPAKPVASITSPESGKTFAVGEKVEIAFGAADVKGVNQVELTIDGQPARIEKVDPPVNSFAATHTWTPETPGSHLIEVGAFNVDGVASDIVQTVVTVTGSATEAAATTAPAAPTATPLPTVPTETPTVVVSPTPVPSPTEPPTTAPSQNKAMATTLVALNVRSGPGLDYPVIGRLAKGESAEISGRTSGSGWWQILFSSDQGDRAWIAAGSQFSTATNAEGVPVVEAPPPPTAAAPTATPTPTSSPLKPTIFSFTADRYAIASGESVTLSWDLANAEAAFLRYNDVEEGVVAPGSKKVSPTGDTVYTLVARNQAGETTAQLTIKVGGSTPTPAPIWKDGKVTIVNGQNVDFDQGVVQDAENASIDFHWDAGSQQFVPRNGATGALLATDYNKITLSNCLTADYGRPITGIDGSSLITGCYRTSEGRYGKFFVSDWDTAGNLTVTWLTWNYR